MNFSTRRLAHARKAIKLDQERNALTPELVTYTSPEQRLEAMERSNAHHAARWKAHTDATRATVVHLLIAMPKAKRQAALKHARIYPRDPVYLLTYLKEIQKGRSPFRDLRVTKLGRMIAQGRVGITFPRWREICEAFHDYRSPRDPVITKAKAAFHARPKQIALQGLLS